MRPVGGSTPPVPFDIESGGGGLTPRIQPPARNLDAPGGLLPRMGQAVGALRRGAAVLGRATLNVAIGPNAADSHNILPLLGHTVQQGLVAGVSRFAGEIAQQLVTQRARTDPEFANAVLGSVLAIDVGRVLTGAILLKVRANRANNNDEIRRAFSGTQEPSYNAVGAFYAANALTAISLVGVPTVALGMSGAMANGQRFDGVAATDPANWAGTLVRNEVFSILRDFASPLLSMVAIKSPPDLSEALAGNRDTGNLPQTELMKHAVRYGNQEQWAAGIGLDYAGLAAGPGASGNTVDLLNAFARAAMNTIPEILDAYAATELNVIAQRKFVHDDQKQIRQVFRLKVTPPSWKTLERELDGSASRTGAYHLKGLVATLAKSMPPADGIDDSSAKLFAETFYKNVTVSATISLLYAAGIGQSQAYAAQRAARQPAIEPPPGEQDDVERAENGRGSPVYQHVVGGGERPTPSERLRPPPGRPGPRPRLPRPIYEEMHEQGGSMRLPPPQTDVSVPSSDPSGLPLSTQSAVDKRQDVVLPEMLMTPARKKLGHSQSSKALTEESSATTPRSSIHKSKSTTDLGAPQPIPPYRGVEPPGRLRERLNATAQAVDDLNAMMRAQRKIEALEPMADPLRLAVAEQDLNRRQAKLEKRRTTLATVDPGAGPQRQQAAARLSRAENRWRRATTEFVRASRSTEQLAQARERLQALAGGEPPAASGAVDLLPKFKAIAKAVKQVDAAANKGISAMLGDIGETRTSARQEMSALVKVSFDRLPILYGEMATLALEQQLASSPLVNLAREDSVNNEIAQHEAVIGSLHRHLLASSYDFQIEAAGEEHVLPSLRDPQSYLSAMKNETNLVFDTVMHAVHEDLRRQGIDGDLPTVQSQRQLDGLKAKLNDYNAMSAQAAALQTRLGTIRSLLPASPQQQATASTSRMSDVQEGHE